MSNPDDIVTFWFGDAGVPETGEIREDALSLWFRGGPEVDDEIRRRFGDDLRRAGHGEYDTWGDDPVDRLALIVVLDQFSRHIHRNSPEAFSFDDRALATALEGLEAGHDRELAPVARAFFYMPLEHAEDLACQNRCVELMGRLVDDAPDEDRELFEGFLDYARQHRDVIDRFGRFPHRNRVLDRETTPEEEVYLAETDHDFAGSPED